MYGPWNVLMAFGAGCCFMRAIDHFLNRRAGSLLLFSGLASVALLLAILPQ